MDAEFAMLLTAPMDWPTRGPCLDGRVVGDPESVGLPTALLNYSTCPVLRFQSISLVGQKDRGVPLLTRRLASGD